MDEIIEIARKVASFFNELIAQGVNSLTATALTQTLLQNILISSSQPEENVSFPQSWLDKEHNNDNSDNR